MSPRIIHIPLSGGDRKAQAKGIRYAHGVHNSYFKESVLIRSAAEAKIREADRLECEAWNAIMWAGGPAMPSPDEPQAEPTVAKAIVNAGEILQRLAGVKVQHGRSKKAPDIGGLLACRFSFLRGVVQRWV